MCVCWVCDDAVGDALTGPEEDEGRDPKDGGEDGAAVHGGGLHEVSERRLWGRCWGVEIGYGAQGIKKNKQTKA